jgi:putative ABC transport system permease protein
MIAGGLAVGVAAALAGAAVGLAAWLAYVPTLQQATGHVVDATNLPWWAFAVGVVFAIATSVLASRRPAKTMAAVPVVAALSGRPAPPSAVHRSALPGVIAFALGLFCLAFAGGLAGPPGGGQGKPPLALLGGEATGAAHRDAGWGYERPILPVRRTRTARHHGGRRARVPGAQQPA